MADTPAAHKRCRLAGCPDRFPVPPNRRALQFCPRHRRRPWIEFWIARTQAGMTVRAVADASGVYESYLHQLSRGDRQPSLDHIEAVADALERPAADLVPHADTVIPPELLDAAADVAEATG